VVLLGLGVVFVSLGVNEASTSAVDVTLYELHHDILEMKKDLVLVKESYQSEQQ
jgi:hypothetical protein